jgi:hypothetical protein
MHSKCEDMYVFSLLKILHMHRTYVGMHGSGQPYVCRHLLRT